MKHNVELVIDGAHGYSYVPILKDEITLEMERRGSPSKLTFTVVKDKIISFPEGSRVYLRVDGKDVFMGFVFKKQRTKEQFITCTAYDQLRYFKNKGGCYIYANKTATEVLEMVAKDAKVQLGTVENTGFKIAKRDESNASFFETVYNALDITTYNTRKAYVLYDDFGKVCLKNIESMILNEPFITVDTAEDFDYATSIDDDTYNKIILIDSDGKPHVAYDSGKMECWGVLQHYETLDEGVNGAVRAKELLKLKNRKTKTLRLTGVLGDLNVRAGCSIPIDLNLGEGREHRYLVCDKVTHHITQYHLSMDLELTGMSLDGGSFV